jgi:hypothetical protein
MNTFTIMNQPFYDEYNKCYKNILMVNAEPNGPLKRIIRQTKLPKLSQYQQDTTCNPLPKCGLAIQSLEGSCCKKMNSGCDLMTPNEIPMLVSFLLGNGYQIENQITNTIKQSGITLTNNKILFTVSYYGDSQPNITYMR